MNTITDMNRETSDTTTPIVPVIEVAAVDGVDTNAFRPYDSQLPVPELDGFRTVKCLYKVAKTGKNAGKAAAENSYIRVADSITLETVTSRITELAPYVVSYLQEQEAQIIRKLHVSGMTLLSPRQYGLDRVLEVLEEAGLSQRLNKEQIEEWFTAEMADGLLVAFADKMGVTDTPTEAEAAKLTTIIGVYKGKFGSLASGKTHYREEEADMLLKALEVTGAGDTALGARFTARLEKMKVNTGDDLLLSL